MKICFINGSPKPKDSNSEYLFELIRKKYLKKVDVEQIHVSNKGELSDEQYEMIQNCDALVFAFPLYCFTVPSHLMQFLLTLEERGFRNPNTRVYNLINCGFFEGIQNENAVGVMEDWCKAVGLVWGQTIALGGGEALGAMKKLIPFGVGPSSTLKEPFQIFAENIKNSASGETLYVCPQLSEDLSYTRAVKHWNDLAAKNGLKKEDLYQGCPPDHKTY